MNYNKKAVYFFCTDYERDEVAPRVLNYLKNNYPLNLRDYKKIFMITLMKIIIYLLMWRQIRF